MVARFRLVCEEALLAHQESVDAAVPTVVGRGVSADVRLSDPLVSRRHCEIDEVGEVLCVYDLGSRNGTFVNGRRVHHALLLTGDRLVVGACRFRVEYERGEPGPHGTRETEHCMTAENAPIPDLAATNGVAKGPAHAM